MFASAQRTNIDPFLAKLNTDTLPNSSALTDVSPDHDEAGRHTASDEGKRAPRLWCTP